MNAVNTYIKKFRRFCALFDKSAWLLIAPAIATIFFFDPALGKTLLTWTTFGVAIAGVSIIISRLIFPHIDLNDLVDEVKKGNLAAAILASAVIMFVALVIIALVVWAKV